MKKNSQSIYFYITPKPDRSNGSLKLSGTCQMSICVVSGTHPKLSSPQSDNRPASIRFPKYFHPVGTSNISLPSFAATLSTAAPVGIDLAKPCTPLDLKYGMHSRLLAMTARLSLGVTKNALFPIIMFRSCIIQN
jgi:hypothetical protein